VYLSLSQIHTHTRKYRTASAVSDTSKLFGHAGVGGGTGYPDGGAGGGMYMCVYVYK